MEEFIHTAWSAMDSLSGTLKELSRKVEKVIFSFCCSSGNFKLPYIPFPAQIAKLVVFFFFHSFLIYKKQIHQHPELAYKEFFASKLLVDYLISQGFKVTYPAYGIETAFIAEYGTGPLAVGFCSE